MAKISALFWLREPVKFGVSGHLPEKAWMEWSEILHADVSCQPSAPIRLWSQSVDFPPFGATLNEWNWSYLWFPGIFWRMAGSKCRIGNWGISDALRPVLSSCVLLWFDTDQYLSVLIYWHWETDIDCPSVSEAILKCMGKCIARIH